tara:strand:- start:202 stop:576 length:375 start_codon:yes stop_codon:yes gene_type:complete
MLPRINRLSAAADIRNLLRRGRAMSTVHFTIKSQPRAARGAGPTKPSRLVIVVSTKVSKSAVVRNRIRRGLVGALTQAEVRLQPGWDVAIIIKPGFKTENIKGSQNELKRLLDRFGILKVSTKK